jgi:hypothetical protein
VKRTWLFGMAFTLGLSTMPGVSSAQYASAPYGNGALAPSGYPVNESYGQGTAYPSLSVSPHLRSTTRRPSTVSSRLHLRNTRSHRLFRITTHKTKVHSRFLTRPDRPNPVSRHKWLATRKNSFRHQPMKPSKHPSKVGSVQTMANINHSLRQCRALTCSRTLAMATDRSWLPRLRTRTLPAAVTVA